MVECETFNCFDSLQWVYWKAEGNPVCPTREKPHALFGFFIAFIELVKEPKNQTSEKIKI